MKVFKPTRKAEIPKSFREASNEAIIALSDFRRLEQKITRRQDECRQVHINDIEELYRLRRIAEGASKEAKALKPR